MVQNKLAGDFHADALSLFIDDSGTPFLELSRLVSEPFIGALGDFHVRASRVEVEQVRAPSDPATGTITASAATLSGVEIILTGPGDPENRPLARLSIGTIELPRGIRIDPGPELFIPAIVARDLAVSVDDILHLAESARAAGAAASGPRAGAFDFSFLDTIDGHLDVDLYVDLTVPLLGRRDETHEFRIAIEGGTFDYERFEGDINWLARSVLDIEVVNGKLILEKDIPLVPFDNKVLLSWPLDPDELALARCHRARLRTLLKYELPPPDRDKKIQLHQIATRKIDIALSMTGPTTIAAGGGRIALGRDDRPGVDNLRVAGEMHYAAAERLPGTVLELAIAGIAAGFEQCWLGASCVAAERIDIDDISDVTVGFQGFVPNRLNGNIARIEIENLDVKAPGSDREPSP